MTRVAAIDCGTNSIRLLIAEDQLEDAEQLISILRNGGMAVRPHRPETEEELEAMLAGQSIDLVLAAFKCKLLPFETVMRAVTWSELQRARRVGCVEAGRHHSEARVEAHRLCGHLQHAAGAAGGPTASPPSGSAR